MRREGGVKSEEEGKEKDRDVLDGWRDGWVGGWLGGQEFGVLLLIY